MTEKGRLCLWETCDCRSEKVVATRDDVDAWWLWIVDFSKGALKIPEKKSNNKFMSSVVDWDPLAVKFDIDDVLLLVRLKDFDFIAGCFVVKDVLDSTFPLLVFKSKSTNYKIFNITKYSSCIKLLIWGYV